MEKSCIVKTFTGSEFFSLALEVQRAMGLRSTELFHEAAPSKEYREEGNILLEDFCFAYPQSKESLRIDRLFLPKGGIIAVIGHNGAGKTTFSRCLCGLERNCKGTVRAEGKKWNRKKRLKSCYLVMQDVNHQLFTESVLEEVYLSMEEEDTAKAEEILKSLDLHSVKEAHPMSLSRGQKQRVAIGSALASDREIIVFDEPTSGQDYKHMKETADSIRKLGQAGKTIFIITHDPEFILSCCSYVIHMEKGSVKESYKTDEDGRGKLIDFFKDSYQNGGKGHGV
jgi:energy-coupling factor transport system ATP-binding protein